MALLLRESHSKVIMFFFALLTRSSMPRSSVSYPGECLGQLGHGLVEGDVLEELDPREEDVDSHRAVDRPSPES